MRARRYFISRVGKTKKVPSFLINWESGMLHFLALSIKKQRPKK
jgi:hypothetical protein